jgi:hypothetical protein
MQSSAAGVQQVLRCGKIEYFAGEMRKISPMLEGLRTYSYSAVTKGRPICGVANSAIPR